MGYLITTTPKLHYSTPNHIHEYILISNLHTQAFQDRDIFNKSKNESKHKLDIKTTNIYLLSTN